MKLKYQKLYNTVLNEYEELSTCDRLHVAAILVKDGRIVSCGYNGTLQSQCHCNETFRHENGKFYTRKDNWLVWKEVDEETWKAEHHKFAEANEVHAEMNCLAFALRNNVDISDCEMILSVAPCCNCAKFIAASGIKAVYYKNEYDRSMEGKSLLESCDVKVKQI